MIDAGRQVWPAPRTLEQRLDATTLDCGFVTIKRVPRHAHDLASFASIGDSYDNALAKIINGLYKTELVHRQGPWRNMQVLEMATLGWVDWFNNRRLLGPIGNIPPAEAEENFYAQRDLLDTAA